MTLPAGYTRVDAERGWGFATSEAADVLSTILESGGTVHEWASGQPAVEEMKGRGTVYSVPAPIPGPDGRERWAVRHYLRGGAMAHIFGDRYPALETPRPVQEAIASVEVRSRGVRTPAVVLGAIYPTGPFYRADVVTELIPDSADLAEVLFGDNAIGLPRGDSLTAAADLVRELELTGVHHLDLNAKNIVVAAEGERVHAYLVDLDRCRVRAHGTPAPAFPMRHRLKRSLRKIEMLTGKELEENEWQALKRGWEATA